MPREKQCRLRQVSHAALLARQCQPVTMSGGPSPVGGQAKDFTVPNILVVSDSSSSATQLSHSRPAWEVVVANDVATVDRALATGVDMMVFDTTAQWVTPDMIEAATRQCHSAAKVALVPEQEVWAAVKTAKIAHQVLSVRSAPGIIADVCDRVLQVRGLISNPELLELVSSAGQLPAPPKMWQDLNAVLEDRNSDVADVAEVIQRDPAIAAQVLRLVNSAFFGVARQVTRLEDAVALLGLAMVRALVLDAELTKGFPVKVEGFERERLQLHDVAVAGVARRIAGKSNAGDAFLASLVMDVGLALLASTRPDQTREVIRKSGDAGVPLYVVEKASFGYSHAEVGACLLGLWGLPMTVIEAVAHHHDLPDLSRLMSVREVVFIARHAVQFGRAGDPYGENAPLIPNAGALSDQMVSLIIDNANSIVAETAHS